MIEVLGYIATLFMGATLGMLGGGGSILTVPILVYLFSIDPVTATAYSLFIVGLAALVGGYTYFKSSQVDFKTGLVFALPSFVGVYLVRALLLPWMPNPVFSFFEVSIPKPLLIMLVFATLMLVASISMILPKKERKKKELSPIVKTVVISLEGLIVGGVTGFVGAGGGFLIIPALVVLVGLPMKIAVGTSLLIISTKSLIGFIGDVQYGPEIDWMFLLIISLLGSLGILAGKALASKFSDQLLKKIFGYFVLIMGSFILIDQIRGLI